MKVKINSRVGVKQIVCANRGQNIQRGEVMEARKGSSSKSSVPKEKNSPSPEAMAEFCRIIAEQLANSKHGCGM